MDGEDFSVFEGDVLCGLSSTYAVDCFLGEGSFAMVARCRKTPTNEYVAVKIMKNDPALTEQANEEIAILERLRVLDPDRCGIVRWNSWFKDGPHICLEFELMEKTLFDFVEQRAPATLLLSEIRNILKQLDTALWHLESIGIIHADIKPENIMLAHVKGQSPTVKVTDFGISLDVSQAGVQSTGRIIQSQWYRAPEVILGLPFTGAIDMWSLGCVAVELFTRHPIYPGDTDYDVLVYITETQGQLPDVLLSNGRETWMFFTKDDSWRLKSRKLYNEDTGDTSVEIRQFHFGSLDDLVHLAPADSPEHQDMPDFIDLVKGMLQLEAGKRITPRAVLEHRFITPEHNVDSCLNNQNSTEVSPFQMSENGTMDLSVELTSASSTATPHEVTCESVEDPTATGDKATPHEVTWESVEDPTATGDKATPHEVTCESVEDPTATGDKATPHEVTWESVEDPTATGDKATPHEVTWERVQDPTATGDIQLGSADKAKKKNKKAKRLKGSIRKFLKMLCCCCGDLS